MSRQVQLIREALAAAVDPVLKATGGKLDENAFRAAMMKADVKLTRGPFKFNTNHHPIQDWYELKAVKGADGKVTLATAGKVLETHGDAYAADCKL